MDKQFTSQQITSLNYSYPWNGSIINANKLNDKKIKYELYPTGDCDLDGRKYVALPVGTKINQDLKIKYNLI